MSDVTVMGFRFGGGEEASASAAVDAAALLASKLVKATAVMSEIRRDTTQLMLMELATSVGNVRNTIRAVVFSSSKDSAALCVADSVVGGDRVGRHFLLSCCLVNRQ